MAGNLANFGGKRAVPFGKRRKLRGKLAAEAKRRGIELSAEQNTAAVLDLAVLSTKKRNSLPSSAFVFPKSRAFPIHDRAHAVAALRLSGRKSPAVQAKVRAAVKRRYPDLGA